MAWEDSFLLQSHISHRKTYGLRAVSLADYGQGRSAITVCLILDIDSQLPNHGGAKGSSYLQQ